MQYNKVQICGINTANLKTISNDEKIRLLKEIKNGNQAAREEFLQANLRLVLSVIQRFTNRGENLDDLFQVGCIGLMKATDNFDLTQEVRFSTYAVPMIIGELRRYLRDNNSVRVSRSLRDIAYKALQMREQLQKQNIPEPTNEMIAKELDIPLKSVNDALEAIQDPVSLFEPVYNEGGESIYVMDQISDEEADKWFDSIALDQAMHKLSTREKHILYMRYFQGRTQMEVASSIGISQAQVSRLEKSALNHMRKHI